MTALTSIFADHLFLGKTVLVTGGGRGIGREIALAFARLGADCVIASRQVEALASTAAEIEALGRRCLVVPTNIRDTESVDNLVEQAIEQMGQIDFLINNAGGQFPANPLDISDNGWRAVVDLNLNGTWNVTNRVGRHMVARGFGAIVNIVHIYSYARGAPDFPHSGAARAGVVNLTKSLAFHWARHNVTINCVAPGTISTDGVREEEFAASDKEDYEDLAIAQIPAKRLGEADETASLCVFLCSPGARYINGSDLVVDGGNGLASWVPLIEPA
ncbi:MAG: SDR family oxidoreductase [Gammaproteobacteria bacterium]|jgi:NAD(P)-dependent dehydrogenase (short-subunit alcohol dehydrogenase family)|nr:SDR family oxidoreductase [Gammaproteobacteria bacterium]MCH1549964.1 SDR family oxidoreductase [Pseudomonadales bacterium]